MSKKKKQGGESRKNPISVRRAFGSAIPICLFALALSGAIISVANDVYAFVKPDKSVTVSISESLDTKEFSRLLQKNGIIRNAPVFEYYLNSHGLSEKTSELIGQKDLNSSMSYRELVDEIY